MPSNMLVRLRPWLAVALLVAAGCASVDESTAPAPEQEPESFPVSAALAGATDDVFSEFVATDPGCALAVGHDGRVDYDSGYGAHSPGGPALDRTTIFDIASVSKQMTAGTIMLLVLDGQVELDASIDTYLSSLPEWSTEISVADMVHHTSGIEDYVGLLDADDDEVTTATDAYEAIAAADELEFDPGTGYSYSNSNYFLLAEVVKSVTGETLTEFAGAELFPAANMPASRFRDDQGTLGPGQAPGWAKIDGVYETAGSGWQQTGDGAVHSNVIDMLAWASLFSGPAAGDGIGSQAWRDLMLTPGSIPNDDGDEYGGGVTITGPSDEPLISHDGSWIGYSSFLGVYPDSGLSVAIACNVDDLAAADLGIAVLEAWRDAS